ncbi:MAG: UDP-N-acetylmuramate--alanine ligase, partial [Erysipelotrichaceae bacterium]|nr:UDP-N-acetylmuramate--alanine ligase [Erysipelotrichaceae bacterium]
PFSEKHLLYDAMAVLSLSYMLAFDPLVVEQAFSAYSSPKRRFKVEKVGNTVFIDDYAHHPTEVKVTLETARHRYPDKEIVAVFKPHRASRVLYFAQDFRDALNLADKVYLLDFTSIDDKQDGTDIDIHYLANGFEKSVVLSEDEKGVEELASHKDACFVFMSSKDIYHLAQKVKDLLK